MSEQDYNELMAGMESVKDYLNEQSKKPRVSKPLLALIISLALIAGLAIGALIK